MSIRSSWPARSLAALTVVLVLAATACSDDTERSEPPDQTDPTSTEPMSTEPPTTEPTSTEPTATEPTPTVPTPMLSGPISGGDNGVLFGASLTDLEEFGYVEEEFFLEGDARTYGAAPGTSLDADGKWSVVETGTVPYKSRMIVRRPSDPAAFNGTVIVFWLNASAGFEIGDFGDPQLLSRGFAQVFVSAQRDGLEGESITGESVLPGLREWDPTRYGSLSIPSNDASFDVFSQAAVSVGPGRTVGAVDPLPGMEVEQLIAYGGSQSAAWLLTYYNGVQPLDQVFDGFMPILHFGTARPLATGVEMPDTPIFREDSSTPVLLVNGENEAEAYAPSSQPDTETFRLWDYAGINHTGGVPGADLLAEFSLRDFGFPFPVGACDQPLNTLDTRFVFPAGVVAIDTWVRTGEAPSEADPITVADGRIVRDELGNAIGGIKIPQVAVPTSTHGAPNGDRETNLICFLQGYEVPFDEATIDRLYPSEEEYLAAIDAAADDLERQGFILPEDATAERDRARQRSGVGE